MFVNGTDCSIVIKTTQKEMDVPYSEETMREAVSLLVVEPSIEGDGMHRAIQKRGGVSGCVVTPLTIGTAPLLLYLTMGSSGLPVFVSETKNLYQYRLNLLPMEDADCFDLIQDRGGERRLFESCRVRGFELRFNRGEAIKLKLDIYGEYPPVTYPYTDTFEREQGERFSGDCVTYKINGQEYKNIYGLTLTAQKESGTKTEIWIKRALKQGPDLPGIISELTITAQLLRDKYEYRHFGIFRITVKNLVLNADETTINAADSVIGPLRYFVADTVTTEVFTSGVEVIA